MSAKGNNPRPDLKEMRQKEAAERQEAYGKKTALEIIAELDARYGAGHGAKKVRAKLAKKLEAMKNTPTPTEKKVKK